MGRFVSSKRKHILLFLLLALPFLLAFSRATITVKDENAAFKTRALQDDMKFALEFNASDYDYVDCGSDSSLDVDVIGVMFWMKPQTMQAQYSTAIGNSPSGSDSFQFTRAYGKFRATITVNASTYTLDDNVLSNTYDGDTWIHFAFTYDNTTFRLYKNGVEIANSTIGGNIDDLGLQSLNFGRSHVGVSTYYNGTLDEILIYNRSLGSHEITFSYDSGNGVYTPYSQNGLVAWFHFDEGSGIYAYDETANDNDGTLINGLEWVTGRIPTEVECVFYVGNELDFYHAYVNATHLQLDKSYTAKYLTQYRIYVIACVQGVNLTLDSWFNTANSSATINIESPTSTNFTFAVYSLNFLSASATGVVWQNWVAANYTLLMVGNTDTSSTIVINAEVTETPITNIDPECKDIKRINYGTARYDLACGFWDGNGYAELRQMMIAVSNGSVWANFSYTRANNSFAITSGSSIISSLSGSATSVGFNSLRVVFRITPSTQFLNVTSRVFYMWCDDINGASDGWEARTVTLQTQPENLDAIILNPEGCGLWVFSQREQHYYNFRATYRDEQGWQDLETMKLRFKDDGDRYITAVYSDDVWSLETGGNYSRIKTGSTNVVSSTTLQVIFPLFFENTIIDTLDVDIELYSIDSTGRFDGWETIKTDYFNIYNLGGQGTLDSSGDAGRLAAGDIFDLYADNMFGASLVEATYIFRNLQHVKMLPTVTVSPHLGIGVSLCTGWTLTYYMDYCTNEDDWVKGWRIDMTCTEIDASGSARKIGLQVSFYNRELFQDSETIYFYYDLTTISNSTFRFWVDLWFNKMEGSSTVGARVNAYYYPMKDDSHVWLRWLTGSSWGIDEDKIKQTMFFGTLQDEDRNRLYTSEIELMRIGCKLLNPRGANLFVVNVYDYDVFDLTFGSDPMEGIQTPVFDETKVPVMPQGGFLGWIASALMGLFRWLGDNVIFGGLNLWQHFVDFIDIICGFFGYPKAFTYFLENLRYFWDWMISAFGYIITFLTSLFNFLAEIMTSFLTIVATVLNNWILVVRGIINVMTDWANTGVSIWDDLNLLTWITIAAIFYPIYLIIVWEQQGIDGVINQIRFLMDVAAWIIRIFITVIQFAIRLIVTIIEFIPVIE